MDDFRLQFGRHLATLRQAKGLTQDELASRVDVADRTIRRIELGENAPGFDLLPKLAKGLNISVKRLFDF